MEQFKQFNVEKQAAINTLGKLREILEELGGMDIDVQDDLNKIAGAISTIESSTVQYSMDKRPADMWNFIVGGQYQFSKHFMVRGEGGFLGSRTQFIAGVQYRFGRARYHLRTPE